MTNPFLQEPTLTDLEKLIAERNFRELQDFVYRCESRTQVDLVKDQKPFSVTFCYSHGMWSASCDLVPGKMGVGRTPEDALSALIR